MIGVLPGLAKGEGWEWGMICLVVVAILEVSAVSYCQLHLLVYNI
jgi:hypothetical protein